MDLFNTNILKNSSFFHGQLVSEEQATNLRSENKEDEIKEEQSIPEVISSEQSIGMNSESKVDDRK